MEDELTYDIEEFLSRARERRSQFEEEPYDDTTLRAYARFSNIEDHDDYYQQVKVCKAILSDIRARSSYVTKMERYCPHISALTSGDITKIRYNPEDEAYIIYAQGAQYEIYEDDVRFIYPSIADIPDSYEYEVVIEDSSVYVYNKFTADPPFRVFGAPDEAEAGAE